MSYIVCVGCAMSGFRGRIQDFGKGRGGGGGTGGGVPPPVTARGSGGTLIAPPVGSGSVFLLLRLFSMKFTVISNIYITRYPDY